MGIAVLLFALIASSTYGATAKRADPNGLAVASPAAPGVFDVTKFGATHKDKVTEDETNSLNALAFGRAWNAACHSPGKEARLVIPKGKFVVGPTPFVGPCSASVTVDIQGTIKPNPDGSIYFENYWLSWENVNDVTIIGAGIIDGQGEPYEYCKMRPDCSGRPNIKLFNVTNVLIDGVKSINPTFAHVYMSYSRNVTVRNMKMTAPENSVRTDGVHISQSEHITIVGNTIATGTDCVTIVHGSKDITITDLNCGPAATGISIGSFYTLTNIGAYVDKMLDVEGVLVKKSNFSRTTMGTLAIKTILGAKGSKVSAITFEDLVMDHVKTPIIIHQADEKNPAIHPLDTTAESVPVKISDIHFKNIKGTSTTRDLVNLACSPLVPCEGVEIADDDLVFDAAGAAPPMVPAATCLNAKVIFNGKHVGINC